MIRASSIQAWSAKAPWPDARQIEQDLIICRALCDLFNAPGLKGKIAFRGGTAINKLLFKQPLRYSEDIDLVQTAAAPIGATVDAIREALSWLGKCRRDQAEHSMHLEFKFAPEADPQTTLKLKVEINTREQSSLFGIKLYRFAVSRNTSCWRQGRACERRRALYQGHATASNGTRVARAGAARTRTRSASADATAPRAMPHARCFFAR